MQQTRSLDAGSRQGVHNEADDANAAITIGGAQRGLKSMVAALRALPVPPPLERVPMDPPDRG